ncbi:MAG: methyltransferase cognate corrinoid protein [Prevotella sp.]|nr:methyltransferase cognate corrinoid protein [Prevotella sp.]
MWPLLQGHHLSIVGGCCGTTDRHINLIAQALEPVPGLRLSALEVNGEKLEVNTQHPTLNTQHPTLNTQHPTLNTQHSVFEAIVAGKSDDCATATHQALEAGQQPQDIINNEMIRAMGEVGQRFQNGKAFVPQLLMAGRAMKAGLEVLKPLMAGQQVTSLGKVLIGTVKGDLHDIGKNLVASMLEGCGFEVVNIGIDVSADTFVEEIKKNRPDILAMSALLTTTMGYMKEVIDALQAAGIRDQVKVMVGGAPVSQGFADEIGADGYSDNANSAVTVAKQLLGRL